MFFPESFIEVSEEEFKQEEEDEDQLGMIRNAGSPDDVHEDGTKKEEKTELKLKEEEDRKRQTEETELKEVTETESSSAPEVNEWEHFDVVSVLEG